MLKWFLGKSRRDKWEPSPKVGLEIRTALSVGIMFCFIREGISNRK